jgi:transposase-like protein
MDLRRETQQRMIATLLLMGWSVSRIARKLHCTDRAIRWRMNQEEFQRLFDEMQQGHFKTVHRKLGGLLHEAANALERLLKHSDWRARDATIQHILRVHGKFIDRIDISGTLDHRGQVRQVHGELVEDAMTDEMRTKARELLAMQRQKFAKQLPARFAHRDENDPLSRDHGANGGFFPKEHDTDESAR